MIPISDSISKISSVAAGNRFTVDHPVGDFAVEEMGLEMSGTTFTKAHITDLALLVNTKPVRQYRTIEHLEAIAAYYGDEVLANRIILALRPNHFQNKLDADKLVFGLRDVSAFSLEASIASAAVAPALKAYSTRGKMDADVDVLNNLGLFTKVKNMGLAVHGSSQTEVDNIVKEGFIQAIHVFHGGHITGGQAWLNGVNVWNCGKDSGGVDRMAAIVGRGGRRVPQENVFHMDWMLKDQLGDQLPVQGAYDFRLKLDHDDDDDLVIYVEYLSTWAGI